MIKKAMPVAALGVLVAGAILAASAQETALPPPPTVDVRARVSADGRFVGDLTIDDFAVLEDGRPREISSLTLVRDGRIVRACLLYTSDAADE